MNKSFIDEVRNIIISNLADEKFGVRELASLLNLSSSQTLRKVNAATGKSVNQYIRELRLEKAANLLKETDNNVSEIAYQVGFNSASYFNKAFSKYFGVTPGEYKTSNISLIEINAQKREVHSLNNARVKKLVYVFIATFLAVFSYFLINKYTSNKNQIPKSIAVLPFKDFSPEDNQWFSDGVSDNILHSLAQMNNLTVISYTSSSTYRDSDKKIPVIAKELGVSYVLEGSVTHIDDKIKIIVQLIDANDKHIWSGEYNESFDDLIVVQNNVAYEVMKQLQITLSPQEKVILTKFPTENMEAYSLFLKGRLVDNSRKKEDLWKSIEFNKQAIKLDPKFAEAHAEIAHAYRQLSRYHGFSAINAFDGIELAHKYVDSALYINPNTYRAWAVKAALSQYIDWDKTTEYYEKALALNPNDPLTHIECALNYQLRPNPDIKKCLEQLDIAKQLDPISPLQAMGYLRALIYNNKTEEAKIFLKNNAFQLNDFLIRTFEYKIIAYENKDWTKVISYLKDKENKDSDNDLYYSELAYASNAILNDNHTAVEYMKKARKIDSLKLVNVLPYINMLIEDKQFKEAYQFMQLENFKSSLNKRFQLNSLWYYYYLKGDSEKTLEVSKDSLLTNDYLIQALTYAKLGNRKKVDSINKKYPYGTGVLLMWRANRAIIHAVLKDKDSMYYYLEQSRFDDNVLYTNARSEFDPYRHEARYNAFLRTNYLPVPKD